MNNYQTKRGDDFLLNVAFKNSAGAAEDITDWSIFFTMKEEKYMGDNDDGVIKIAGVITDASDGLATVTVPSSITEDLLGSYYYDIQYKDDTGVIKTVDEGVVTFSEDITIRTA